VAKKQTAKPHAPASLSTDAVTDQLRSYATRGVFREFSVRPLPSQRVEFRFVWLTNRPIHAVFDARTSVLKLVSLLPGIAPRSPMDRALREFITERFSTKLPAHRRLSRTLVRDIKCTNHNSALSLSLTLNRRQPAEGAKQTIHLISEIFQSFLAGPYHEYMVVNFEISED